MSKPLTNSPPNIFLYVANIMDYFRVICSGVAFWYAKTHPILFLVLYFFSFVLDAFDGMAARALNQKSKYGATLDMVIDRISTSGLLMVLSSLYPKYSHYFIFLMMLDIGSHWLQTHSGFMNPKVKNDNHKNLEEKFWILNFYYKTKFGLLTVCLGAELFLLMAYYVHFHKELYHNPLYYYLLMGNFAIYCLKQFISIVQTVSASQRIAAFDVEEYLETLELKNREKNAKHE
jgi:CDP-diacylglycerol--inositol 3-phosphatidyltransferase